MLNFPFFHLSEECIGNYFYLFTKNIILYVMMYNYLIYQTPCKQRKCFMFVIEDEYYITHIYVYNIYFFKLLTHQSLQCF